MSNAFAFGGVLMISACSPQTVPNDTPTSYVSTTQVESTTTTIVEVPSSIPDVAIVPGYYPQESEYYCFSEGNCYDSVEDLYDYEGVDEYDN